MGVDDLTKANDDGTNFGQSASDKIGFYGLTTPIVKATITLGAGTTTTLLKADVLAIATALHNLGILTEAGL
ncbi:MAG: hypothetical protein H8D23_11440 [Candidatus Brocadiales bacterium]|nr:hypothetical protein [Candidatus Brocadiales bacterium]